MSGVILTIIETTNPAGIPVSRVEISDTVVLESLLGILQDNVLCSMATVTPDHRAHINTAYYCYSDELELYFLSHPSSHHCRNLSANPSMALTVFSSAQKWGGQDRGLQLFGTCAPAGESQAIKAEELYGRRFPAFSKWKKDLAPDDFGREYRFYQFLASEVKVFDERNLGGGLFVLASVMR